VVAIDVDTLPQAWLLSRLSGAKLLYYSIELYAERPGFRPAWFWIGLERQLINTPDLTVACEPNRARVMVEKYGAKTFPMVIQNVPPFEEPRRTTKIQDWLVGQLPPDSPLAAMPPEQWKIVYYMGELKRARCTDEFIEAAKTFAPGIVLFFIGPIETGYDPRAKIAACGVGDRVFIHPPVHPSEVMDFAYSAHLGLQTQLDDGLNHLYCAPIKLFQYLMAGLPVIASNFPGMIDVVEKNDVGVCADPLDAAAIASAINQVLADDPTWRRMSANALRLAREQFNYEKEGAPLFEAVARLTA
jgi:glycosyltransferase involved in cell wall biosynthesis